MRGIITTTGVVLEENVEENVRYEIMPFLDFSRGRNEVVCKAFDSTNSVHEGDDGVVIGNLVTGYIGERLLDWVRYSCPQLCPEGSEVLLVHMSINFLQKVIVEQPLQLFATVVSMRPKQLEFRVELISVETKNSVETKTVALEGTFKGMVARKPIAKGKFARGA